MAVLSTTTAVYISRQNFCNGASKNSNVVLTSVASFASKQRGFYIRSSSDGAAETAATEVSDSENYIEVPGGPPSLISALNVERALRGIPITDVDHYGRLGIQRRSSYEEVAVAYKNKVEEILNQGLDEAEVREKLELLKESHTILSSRDERRMYDWSLARSEKPETYMWPYEVDFTPTAPPPPQEPEDEGPTRLVGYFAMAWLILAVTLSVTLNR
ncbi:hypothetical protein SADUNF_Sadunf06G0175700 [Salix dunnii]|uniref:Chaperone DnaJ-domain superfamily protein n=1 Tax=Salix dunnii TaxID=1413687 RepID=A0A835MXV3_9ROSI|nr:hypothetical protein SADUNF_Sadunf06G0175700 [Salix dunnii]